MVQDGESSQDIFAVRRPHTEQTDGDVDTVKAVASERELPIPEPLAERLEGLSCEGWIFQAKNGSPLNEKNVMRRYVKPAAKAAGLASSRRCDTLSKN